MTIICIYLLFTFQTNSLLIIESQFRSIYIYFSLFRYFNWDFKPLHTHLHTRRKRPISAHKTVFINILVHKLQRSSFWLIILWSCDFWFSSMRAESAGCPLNESEGMLMFCWQMLRQHRSSGYQKAKGVWHLRSYFIFALLSDAVRANA